jgi:hypothetical protein
MAISAKIPKLDTDTAAMLVDEPGGASLSLSAGAPSRRIVGFRHTAAWRIGDFGELVAALLVAPLELWFVTRLVTRHVDLYLDTLYSAFEMIASGITTVQHLHGWLPGGLAAVEAGAGEVIRAYEDIGMRVSYSFALRDQNRLVYQDDKQFAASLPAEPRPAMERHFARFQVSLADYGALEYARRRDGGTALVCREWTRRMSRASARSCAWQPPAAR